LIWPLLLLASVVSAEPAKPSLEFSGYLKELWQYSQSVPDSRPYFLNLDRARLSLDAKASVFRGHVDYDHEVDAGSYFRTLQYRAFGFPDAGTYLDMDQTISTGTTNAWRHRLYRGWLGVESETGVARFGRQRIAWGTGKIWNPTDVLNPFEPLQVERDERRGVDAFYARQGLGDLSQAELAYALGERWTDQSLLARVKSHFGEYDVSLMGGKVSPSTASYIVGGDFAGNLYDGTFHGEWSYTDLKNRTPFWKADLGYEYTFPTETRTWVLRDATLLGEYFHNGSGALDTAKYDFAAVLSGRDVAVARDYVGLTYTKDVHPLVKLELITILNCDDGSQFFMPDAAWNAAADLYLTAGFQRFGGPKRTELGRPANLLFLQAQYYF
jgi:hypothetical protein